MKRFSLILALALSALVVLTPASSAGAETLHRTFKGKFADAEFLSTDPSGCVVTEVILTAVDGRITGPGGVVVGSEAFVAIDQEDVCTDTTLVFEEGVADLAPREFRVSGRLKKATLGTTIELEQGGFVEVSMTWTGTGDLVQEINGFSREATASGTVSVGTTNFTPEPAVSAELSSEVGPGG